MSRYYRIEVSPQSGAGLTATWTNRVNGKLDLGAQMVEFDIWATAADQPASLGSVRIWGPSQKQVSQASDFNGSAIKVYAGMQNGLPLASAAVSDNQQGLILSGQIWQAFGNNQGINQTLDFVIVPLGSPGTQDEPANISFVWAKGDKMADMIRAVLSQAAPDQKLDININDGLVLTQDEHGTYQTLTQFARYVRGVSTDIIKGNYAGVSIVPQNGTIRVFDGTATKLSENPISINGRDMIGNATWLRAFMVQFSAVMRADLQVGNAITFPRYIASQAVTTASSESNARSSSAFQGSWTIMNVRQIGNSRAPDANSWITTVQAYSNAPANALSTANTSA